MVLALVACEREARRFTTAANNETPAPDAARLSINQPAAAQTGPVKTAATTASPYEENAYAVNQGKRLYRWYNCNGCHSNGGGGMGPPLMDDKWRYGSSPADIFATIMQGRPNGMPSFGGHIPEDQAWQIVAYVRSMSGQLRKDVAPSRSDTMYAGEPENARRTEKPRAEAVPVPQPAGPRP
ncbi:cytochrome c [Ramlibacter sp. GTP1]|uniref:Cytochrome c n=2 Tax=Ramlibacter albus TaxID=2079448 RepID=A0A923S512_9BURK|nr:cytochrome c [Ramlibacter albus]